VHRASRALLLIADEGTRIERINFLEGNHHLSGKAKKPYQRPVLKVYGDIRELTGTHSVPRFTYDLSPMGFKQFFKTA